MPSSHIVGFVTVTCWKLYSGYCHFELLFHRLLGVCVVSFSFKYSSIFLNSLFGFLPHAISFHNQVAILFLLFP